MDPRGIPHLTNSILKSLECQFLQNTTSEINEQSKLHLFREVTHTPKPARYLSSLTNRNERSLFSKLRLGTLKLEVETGRHEKPKIDKSKRFCKLCNLNKIGNECHFLFDCPSLRGTRKPLLENITNSHHHLTHLSSVEKAKYLFFNNHIDNSTLSSASTLLWELFEKRNTLITLDSPTQRQPLL